MSSVVPFVYVLISVNGKSVFEIRGKRVGPLGSIDYAGSLKLFCTKSVNECFIPSEKLAFSLAVEKVYLGINSCSRLVGRGRKWKRF